jgi:hypothetical protein
MRTEKDNLWVFKWPRGFSTRQALVTAKSEEDARKKFEDMLGGDDFLVKPDRYVISSPIDIGDLMRCGFKNVGVGGEYVKSSSDNKYYLMDY